MMVDKSTLIATQLLEAGLSTALDEARDIVTSVFKREFPNRAFETWNSGTASYVPNTLDTRIGSVRQIVLHLIHKIG